MPLNADAKNIRFKHSLQLSFFLIQRIRKTDARKPNHTKLARRM